LSVIHRRPRTAVLPAGREGGAGDRSEPAAVPDRVVGKEKQLMFEPEVETRPWAEQFELRS